MVHGYHSKIWVGCPKQLLVRILNFTIIRGYDEEQLEIAIREVLAKKMLVEVQPSHSNWPKICFYPQERSFERKLKELLYTLKLERRLEKDENF